MNHHLLMAAGIIGTGVVSGVFFAFSGFIMPGLGRLPAPQGVAAMQAMNITAVTPPLMIALFGTAVVCLGIVVEAAVSWGTPRAALQLFAALLYLIGVVGVTMAFNVPRNNALAALQPDSAEAARYWTRYLREWTTWNTIRALTSGIAMAALIAAR